MKCPLAATACIIRQGDLDKVTDECLRVDCAWWDKDNSQCAVTTLANGMWILDQLVTGVANRMPPARE